jgi:hypothetical protein
MITIGDYWMGRNETHFEEFTEQIQCNGVATVSVINKLLERASFDGVNHSGVASGWRPASVNHATSNSAAHSKHIDALACDIRDDSGRTLSRWCLRNLAVLEEFDLYMEDPQWTPTWVHLSPIPPKSGHRVYIPSTSAPLAPPLPEQ